MLPNTSFFAHGSLSSSSRIGHMTNDPEDSTAFQMNLPGYQGGLNK
ncbi:hypothetical protein ACFOG5_24790 [Pedobacter fastidiosus]